MITTISNHLIDWLIREDTLQPADRELYVYAAKSDRSHVVL